MFDKATSVSAKVSFPVMTGLFFFGFFYERTILDAAVNPENWGLVEFVEKGYLSYICTSLIISLIFICRESNKIEHASTSSCIECYL